MIAGVGLGDINFGGISLEMCLLCLEIVGVVAVAVVVVVMLTRQRRR
jgi:hypothetical protein